MCSYSISVLPFTSEPVPNWNRVSVLNPISPSLFNFTIGDATNKYTLTMLAFLVKLLGGNYH